MAESSLFAQRLHAITERRRLQERILATRRELEEERLRVQRLKRKSLRERWLMEGTSMPADDKDHMSSLWEAESRVQDLQQDLSSLQSQMQDLDNMDLPQGQQQQSLKEVKQLDGIVKIVETSSSSPEKGNTTETKLELASVSPQEPMEAATKEELENGDMSGDGISDNECSSEKTGVKINPVTIEGGDFQLHQGKIEAAPTTKNLDPSEAPTAHQRKLAVEKMVIRDHLGQEVGSMDAVGQTQNFIRKEDELGDHDNIGNDCEEWSTSGNFCNVVDQKKTGCATKNHLDCDLGSRDGPEGASPTSHDQQNPSNLLQDSANCLDSSRKQGDSEQEVGLLVKEAVLMEMGQKELPEQNAEEAEPARNLAVCNVATEEAAGNQANHTQKEEMQECRGSDTIMLEGAEEGEETKQSVSDQIAPGQETTILSPLEEAKLDPVMTSSSSDQIPSLSDTKVSLPEQNPLSFQETEILFLQSEQSLLPNQSPSLLLDQSVSLQENKDSLLGQTPSPLPESFVASNPSSLQDHFSSPEQKAFSLQDDTTLQEAKDFLSDQTQSSIHEANGKNLDQISTALQECSDSVVDQILSTSPDQLTSLPEKISLHEGQRSPHILPAVLDQEQSVLEMKGPLPDIDPSVINQLSSLCDQIIPLEEANNSSLGEVSVPLQVQMPTVTETQTPLLSEGDTFPSSQIPLSENEKKETPTTGPDQIPLALQDQKPPFLDGKEVTGSLTDHSPLQNQTPSCLKDQAQPTVVEHMSVSVQDQTSSLKETEETVPGKTSPILVKKTPTLLDQTPTPNKDQGPILQETTVLDALSTVNQDSAQPLLDATVNSVNQELKEDRDANLASEAENTEIQENIAAEQQPLLNELKTAVKPQDISLGDQQQSKSGIQKHQGASVQEAPIYITTDGNPASCHLQPAASHQEEGQEQGQNRRKQKTCQCCLVM
ncbi:paralemmin-3 [Ahaetulla prasina]|uniref:paralemmin-3 n=1 Tax=Ahaetulla prasina TaxID=499056 RepID=UPI00264A27FC|nr:paralemmin-3 [Ahaetulla prasina]XP_058029054.1 paralemmin-3 [Ahaetulla prasina]